MLKSDTLMKCNEGQKHTYYYR